MRKQKEIIISGVGGQGTILCGTLIAEAAVLHDHRKATLSSDYGVETRGTFAKSDVIVSDEEIFFPNATKPDVIVCLHQIAYQRYTGKTDPHTLILYNSDEVVPDLSHAENEIGVSISTLAREEGNPQTANILTMGILAGYLDVVTPEGAENAIAGFFHRKSDKIIQMNQHAFETGYAKGKSLL